MHGNEIIIVNQIALDGTYDLINKNEDELKKRFSASFLNDVKNKLDIAIKAGLEAYDAVSGVLANNDGAYIFKMSEGGLYSCLWDAWSTLNTGFDVDVLRIPLYQESIEICNYLMVNPYEISSPSSFAVVVRYGGIYDEILELVHKNGLDITVKRVGILTNKKAKRLLNSDEVRFLDKPKNLK